MFAKHEAYLRQVMKQVRKYSNDFELFVLTLIRQQREEKFKELEKSILSTGKEIEKYKELNDVLFQKILKLESALDSEHTKIKQKIVEEEQHALTSSPTFSH